MNPKYRFFIYPNDEVSVRIPVTPGYKTDLTKDYELENNQKFYRIKLSGKLSFLGRDFDYIMSQPFDTQFNLLIERSDDWGLTWVHEFIGKFFKTDCKINEDDKVIEVQPDPVDEYTEVLAGLEKEYNLITIAPEIDNLIIHKRPLIQLYIPGDNIVSCFLGGNNWEQAANATTDLTALVNTYHFALCNLLKEINLTVSGNHPGATGLYVGRMSISGATMTGTLNAVGITDYYIYIYQEIFAGSFGRLYGKLVVDLKRSSDNIILYRYEQTDSAGNTFDNMDFTMNPAGGGVTGSAAAEMATYRVYARYLLDVDIIQDLNTYPLPGNDIVEYNRNYRRAIGYAIDVAYISTNFSTTPTEWGRADNLRYYLPPYSFFGQEFYPIARSTWRYASIWFSFNIWDSFMEIDGRKRYTLRDTYPVFSVINVLLKQFAPGITHTETPDCSEFFYAPQNPLTYQKFKLFVTAKSNILNGAYTQPAQKAPATLGQFLNMLRDVYRCFWHIENGKLRIEHVSWYENGGSYSYEENIGIDLTNMLEIRNGKTWAFASSKYEYDKVDMPERYQFNWMDDVTLGFAGLPMQVTSKFITPGKIEEISISNFTSDIDMMMLNPGDMSSDGFALLAGTPINALVAPDGMFGGSEGNAGFSTPRYDIKSEAVPTSEQYLESGGNRATANFEASSTNGSIIYIVIFNSAGLVISDYVVAGTLAPGESRSFNTTVIIRDGAATIGFSVTGDVFFRFYGLMVESIQELPFVQRTVDGVEYSLQNGYLAFVTLQPNYYTYDLPSYNVEINGEPGFVNGIQKKKKQVVSFPLQGSPNLMQLVRTDIGNGMIDKMSVNLHSRMTKTNLKYDTE